MERARFWLLIAVGIGMVIAAAVIWWGTAAGLAIAGVSVVAATVVDDILCDNNPTQQ